MPFDVVDLLVKEHGNGEECNGCEREEDGCNVGDFGVHLGPVGVGLFRSIKREALNNK